MTCWVPPLEFKNHDKFTHLALLMITIACSMTLSSVGSLLDAITLNLLKGNEKEYGKQRVWASISWGLGSFITGYLIEYTGDPFCIIYVYLFFSALFIITACYLPDDGSSILLVMIGHSNDGNHVLSNASSNSNHASSNSNHASSNSNHVLSNSNHVLSNSSSNSNHVLSNASSNSNHASSNSNHVLSNSNHVLSNSDQDAINQIEEANEETALLEPFEKSETAKSLFDIDVIFFLITFNLIGMTFSIIASYLFIYLKKTWYASPFLLGATTIPSILWELPIFYFSSYFLTTIGPKKMTIISLVLLLFRLFLYMLLPLILPLQNSKWNLLILLVESIHGAAFAFSWAAGIHHIQKIAPESQQSAWIGLFCSIYNNLGGIVGNLIGGWGYESFGYFWLWSGCSGLIGIGLVSFLISFHFYEKRIRLNRFT